MSAKIPLWAVRPTPIRPMVIHTTRVVLFDCFMRSTRPTPCVRACCWQRLMQVRQKASPTGLVDGEASRPASAPKGTCSREVANGPLMAPRHKRLSPYPSARQPWSLQIVVEYDPEHDYRAGRGRDHRRAEHLPVFERSGRPPARISLHMRQAPARHTHSETPFGPQQRRFHSIHAKRSPAMANGQHPGSKCRKRADFTRRSAVSGAR